MYENNSLKADINFATSGDHTVIPAPAEGYIAIDHINFITTSSVAVQLKDGATNYGGAYALNNQTVVLENSSKNPKGVITLSAGEAFVINTGAAVQVSGFVRYRIVV